MGVDKCVFLGPLCRWQMHDENVMRASRRSLVDLRFFFHQGARLLFFVEPSHMVLCLSFCVCLILISFLSLHVIIEGD